MALVERGEAVVGTTGGVPFKTRAKGTVNVFTGLDNLEDWDDEELRMGRRRDAKGKFRGRPPRVIPSECHRELTRRIIADAGAKLRDELMDSINALTDIATGNKVAYPGQVQAIQQHLERVLGKPKETVELRGEVPRWMRALSGGIVGEEEDEGQVIDVNPVVDDEDELWEDDE